MVIVIKYISLGSMTWEDKIIWYFDGDGNFLVKSCYKLGSLECFEAGTCLISYLRKWWSGLWHLNILLKVKVFYGESIMRHCCLVLS